jgi:hypothetical protein
VVVPRARLTPSLNVSDLLFLSNTVMRYPPIG